MMGTLWLSHLITILFLFSYNVEGQRIKEKMYESIDGAYACFRRLNGTHQFGCTSSRLGNVGAIHIIERQSDVDWLVNQSMAEPYVAVVHPTMFSKSLLLTLQSSKKVNGVALINNGSMGVLKSFSHEDTCPNRYSGLSSLRGQTCGGTNVWNPLGTSLLLMNLDFPIFYITDHTDIDNMYECYQKYNEVSNPRDQLSQPLCSLQLKSHMYAAVSSQKCMKRNTYWTLFTQSTFCDPLGGRNVWQTLFPRSSRPDPQSLKKVDGNGSIAVLAARMDSTSMFDGLVPSSVGAVTSLVTLIATAELLHRMLPDPKNYDKNVLFLLLTGESYDYIGSSRIVYDMNRGMFPVKPDPSVAQPPPIGLHHIGPFIELSQLQKPPKDQPLYIHHYSDSIESKHLIERLQNISGDFGIGIQPLPASKNLPPASLQTFLAAKPDIAGVILTEHGMQYSNKFYHSVMDDAANLNYTYANTSEIDSDSIQAFLTNVSTSLAHTLFEHVTDEQFKGTAVANPKLMDELLHCFLEQSNCSLFQSAAAGSSVASGRPLSYYVGVSHVLTLVPVLSGAALALLTGKPTNFNQSECHNNVSTDQVYQYIWVSSKWEDPSSTKVCLQTTMNFSSAVSPAFVIDGYDMKSGQYSTWTESVWPEMTVKMFLKPSKSQEWTTLAFGIFVFIISFAVVFFAKMYSEVLFNPGLTST